MARLPAVEIAKHPGYSHIEWDLPTDNKGLCEVAKGRSGGPFKLHYEIHGNGPQKIVLIMGLGAFRTAWKRQTRFFGHKHASEYSVLIWDNRGMGLSDKPSCRYSTSEMAKDTVDILTHIQWLDLSKPKRDLNIVGVSMGGMIAQELGLLIPDHIQSLMLLSTAPRIVRTVPFVENLRSRINMFIPKDEDVQLGEVAARILSSEFLALPDHEHKDHPEWNFPTIFDRWAAHEITKRRDTEGFTRKGFLLQAIAAGWHHKTAKQLQELADKVGRERIAVWHGTGDKMITYHHGELLRSELGLKEGQKGEDITFQSFEGAGHVLFWEKEEIFNQFEIDFIARTAKIP